MGLIQNIHTYSGTPMTFFGGTTLSPERSNFNQTELWFAIYLGEASISKTTSLPDGNNHPNTWRMPLKPGAISSSNRINGSGDVLGTRTYGVAILANLYASGGISSAVHILGMAILANISGSGGVTQATASLLVQMLASISGSGEISDADLKAYLNALANLSGSGEISDADMDAIGELLAVLYGEGVIDSLLIATGELGATIKSYSDLTTEGLRDSIWKAAALNYPDPLTMGGKLNLVSSGGVDYTALSDAIWEALKGNYSDPNQMGGVINILQTKLQELYQIQGLDIDNPLTITPDLRTAGDIDLEVTGDKKTLTIVTRQ